MSISKEQRYAMIRRAALKVQKSAKVIRSNKRLAEDVARLDADHSNKTVNSETNDAYINAYFSDVITATKLKETF